MSRGEGTGPDLFRVAARPWHLLQSHGGKFLLCPMDVLLERLGSRCAISETNSYGIITPHVTKTPPHLAHSSVFPVSGTFFQYLFNASFICFNSLQYSRTAAAETPISPISAILLLHDNLSAKLVPAPRSVLPRELLLQFSSD